LTNFYRSLKPNRLSDGSELGIEPFLLRFKKGSRQIRKILSFKANLSNYMMKQNFVKNFYKLISLDNFSADMTKNRLTTFSWGFLPNKLREFIFKFNSNTLGLNIRVSHFVDNRERGCTFCSLRKVQNPPDENFQHIFFSCVTTNQWLRHFEENFFPELVFGCDVKRKLFWFCNEFEGKNLFKNAFVIAVLWCIKFSIWEAKLSKKTPSNLTITMHVIFLLNNIFECAQRVRDDKDFNNFSICRNWSTWRYR